MSNIPTPTVHMVSDYINELAERIERVLPEDEPGRSEAYYLVGDGVYKRSKRKIVLFISHGHPSTSRTYTKVIYTMPVSAVASRIFVSAGSPSTLPHTIHTVATYRVGSNRTVLQHVGETLLSQDADIVDWLSDIRRLERLRAMEPEGSSTRRKIQNIVLYWKQMRSRIFDMLDSVDVKELYDLEGQSVRTSASTRASSGTVGEPTTLSQSPMASPRPFPLSPLRRASSSGRSSRGTMRNQSRNSTHTRRSSTRTSSRSTPASSSRRRRTPIV